MTDAVAPSALDALRAAVAASDVAGSTAAAARSFEAKSPPIEVIRAAAIAAASHDDPSSPAAPRGLAMLGGAANLFGVLQPKFRPLPALQAIAFLASEPRSRTAVKPPLVVAGEVTHLSRSFLFAVRNGDRSEAESLFLGMVDEGWERRMAGDMLFRAALEDMGEGGRKLFIAVKAWQLARALGFKDSRLVLRPAVRYLVNGPRDRAPFDALLSVLGKAWVDLDGLAAGGRHLDDAGRERVRSMVASPSDAACIAATIALLDEGYAATAVAGGVSVEAAKRVLASDGYDPEAARGLLFAHAARFVLTFSRTSERLYALFQAALRIRSPEPSGTLPSTPEAGGEGEDLCHLAGAIDARNAPEAAARVRAYLARGYSGPRLLDVLANYACRDASTKNSGLNLLLADAAAAEFAATSAPEVPMALAKLIAASPKDEALYASWVPLLGP